MDGPTGIRGAGGWTYARGQEDKYIHEQHTDVCMYIYIYIHMYIHTAGGAGGGGGGAAPEELTV